MDFLNRLQATEGKVGFDYRPMEGEGISMNGDLPLIAASVIKIPIMVEAFRRIRLGTLDPNETVAVRPEDRMPSCGALTYMNENIRPTIMDLITLMIILSDNTATNLLIDRLEPANVNRTMENLDIPGIHLRRKLFQPELARQGITNTVTARGVGTILERMLKGTLLGEEDDAKMLGILANQRLNGKLPFFLHGVKIAHKTGEDDNITHDVGIIYAKKPFVVCMLSNEVDVPSFERLMQDAALELYEINNR